MSGRRSVVFDQARSGPRKELLRLDTAADERLWLVQSSHLHLHLLKLGGGGEKGKRKGKKTRRIIKRNILVRGAGAPT